MSMYVYIIARPRNENAWSVWNDENKEKCKEYFLAGPKEWHRISDAAFIEGKLTVRSDSCLFSANLPDRGPQALPFFWFPKRCPNKEWCCYVNGTDEKGSWLSCGWEGEGDCGDFMLRSARIQKGKSNPPGNGTYPVWIDPIVLRVDLLSKQHDSSIRFIEALLNTDDFETQICPACTEQNYLHYLCRKNLAQKVREQKSYPNSIMRQIVFPKIYHEDPDMFEIIDRLGGTFYVSDFGTGKQPKIKHCAENLTEIQKSVAIFVAKKLEFETAILEPDKPIPETRPLLPKALEWREAKHRVYGTYPFDWPSQFTAIMERFGACGIWKNALTFMKNVVNQCKGRIPSEQQLNWLLPGVDGKFDVIRLFESFAEEFVAPRSRIVFEFPNGELLLEENQKDYNTFRENWSFDIICSQLGGAGTFLRRFLSFPEKIAPIPDARYRNGWWNDWHDALWYNDADVRFTIHDKGNTSKLGRFRLGYSRLGNELDLSGYRQPSRVWFAPATE